MKNQRQIKIFFQVLLSGGILFSSFLMAASERAAKEVHREHEAHVHGGGKLEIAFDDRSATIEFRAAADAIVGFEYQPKKEKDKKTFEEKRKIFETDIGKMIRFAEELKCVINPSVIEMSTNASADSKSSQSTNLDKKDVHGEHADFFARYNVTCAKIPNGTKIKFDFTAFKKLVDLDITVLSGELQKAAEYKGKAITLDLK